MKCGTILAVVVVLLMVEDAKAQAYAVGGGMGSNIGYHASTVAEGQGNARAGHPQGVQNSAVNIFLIGLSRDGGNDLTGDGYSQIGILESRFGRVGGLLSGKARNELLSAGKLKVEPVGECRLSGQAGGVGDEMA